MIRDMEGLIPHGVGVILIVSSIVVAAAETFAADFRRANGRSGS